MKRDFAIEIMSGRKTVEFRDYVAHYGNRILDKKVISWRKKNDVCLTDEDLIYADPIRDVHSLHFYDYNGTWYLDVSIKENGLICIIDEDIQMLHERFNCYEQDENLALLNARGIPETNRPYLFYFVIDKILSSNL